MYDEAHALKLINNPEEKHEGGSKYLFPLHRVKGIMKQDTLYTPKPEAVATMSYATEFFAEHLLEDVKRSTEGKNRVDIHTLF